METKSKKNKHMTLDDRIEIQECLCKGMHFKDIAKPLSECHSFLSFHIYCGCIISVKCGLLSGVRGRPVPRILTR